jgi:lipopolysaccharide/colanic/teichoic acid biosynthesis glycosyltransferase
MTTFSIPDQSFTTQFPAVQVLHRDRTGRYVLKWRQNQLILCDSQDVQKPYLPPLESPAWLTACLQRSPVRLVKLPLDLSESEIKIWADACANVCKAVFLQIPNTIQLPQKQKRIRWWFKRVVDWSIAACLLLLLSPFLLALTCLVTLHSPGPAFYTQWRVGERGKLFQIVKFRTMLDGAEQLHDRVMVNQTGLHKCETDPRVTPLGRWMRKYSLDELPQLINVLRGEMSLVGPRPWALYDARRMSPEVRHRLNSLPGITGIWQVTARSHLRDMDAANRVDLTYLSNWSLRQDLKIVLMTIPKVLSGFGAW